MKHQACLKFILAAFLVIAGCQPALKTQTYALKGVVRKLDPATGEVTISHEDIPGFMAAMTMPFTVENKAQLEGVKPGDKVEGTLRVSTAGDQIKDLGLTEIEVVGRAPVEAEAIASEAPAVSDVLRPGDPVPDFAMTTQDGQPLKLGDLKGKTVVLSFIYTRCPSPEYCPAMDTKFAELARLIGAKADRVERVRLLSVSFDPDHDTPEVLRAHAARRGAKPPLWTFAVASHEELSKIAGLLGLTYVPGTREIDHNLRTAVIGPDGRLVRLEAGRDWTPSDLVKTVLRSLVNVRK